MLEAIRALVAQGMDRRAAVERWLPASSAPHRCDRWLELWISHLGELEAAGERSADYLRKLRSWCAAGGHIEVWWGKATIHEINYGALEEWSLWLAKERDLGPKTRWNVMAAMSAFVGYLQRAQQLDHDIPIPWPKVREHAPRILSAADQRAVLEAIPEQGRGIFLALALLELRPSEASRLRVADYQPGDPGWLTVARTKNGQVKRLPVPDELADWIACHVPREARLEGRPLFTLPYSGRGRRPRGPWSLHSLERGWRKACLTVGVNASLYEGTKNSRATDLLRQGVSERVLQAVLGHRDLRSTRRYARLADQSLVEAIRPRGSSVDPAKGRKRKLLKN